jgi:hypothetical protein
VRTVVAFAAAPLGAIVVFSGTLMSTVVNSESWAGFAEALFGFGAIIYLVYCVGLVLILPIFFALKKKGLLTRLSMVGLGASFGLLVGLLFSGAGWAWVLLGPGMGAASGLVLAILLPNKSVESGSPKAPAHF